MSIFGTIMSKIFHHADPAPAPAPAPTTDSPAPDATASAAPPAAPDAPPAADPATPAAPTETASAAPPTAPESVDVGAVLDGLAANSSETLDWKHSIVDMLKLLHMDSSLTARKELAHELNYSGDTGDSATMNIWLHKQVMEKLAANGGKLPADLKA